MNRRRVIFGLAATAALPLSSAARACGFDGAIDAGFGYVHPRSIELALAVRRAVADGVLPSEALAPLEPGAAGLWRATEHLRRFGRAVALARPTAVANGRPLALLLAEAALWTRYVQTGETRVHAAGPEPSDVALVSDQSVIAAWNAGRISMQHALDRGLLIVDAIGVPAEAATALLLSLTPSHEAARLDERSPWSLAGKPAAAR